MKVVQCFAPKHCSGLVVPLCRDVPERILPSTPRSFFKNPDLRHRRSITMVRSLARDSWSCPGLPTQV